MSEATVDHTDSSTMALVPPQRLRRLQTRIGMALGTLILGLALLLAIALSRAAEREMLRLSATNLENLSEQMARELSEGMDAFLREIIDQSLRDRFRDPESSPARMRDALNQFQEGHPEFAYVSIVDASSRRVVAATGAIFEGGSAAGRPVVEEGIKGPFLGDVHDAVRLAELMPKPTNGETLRFLDVSAPVKDASGKVFRVLATHVAWQWTHDLRDRVFGPLNERRGVEIFLIDTQGKVVLSGSKSLPIGSSLASFATRPWGSAERVQWADRQDFLTYVAETRPQGRFGGFGWKVVARQPYDLAFGPARRLRNAFLAGALALGLIAAAIAWYVAARLVRPVRLLAEAAEATAHGGAWTNLPFHGHVGEVSAVQRAIIRLAESARVQAQVSATKERQFAVLAESLPQVVWQADATGRLEYVNKTWIRSREQDAPAYVQDLERLIHADDCAHFSEAWAGCLATGADLSVRCRLHTPDAAAPRWFDLEAHAVRGDDGRVAHWVGTIFDVHEMVMMSERTNRTLEEERSARAEAERVSHMRDEFLATVSHELRSPLSAITGWSDILERKGGADAMLLKAAAVIRRNAQLQASLIDDLLDMSAVWAGKLVVNPAPFDLAALTREVALSHLHAAQQKGVALSCSDEPTVMVEADERRISQVISNLIGNAVKFTNAGGRVDVTTSANGGTALVRVDDTGRGITKAFLPHVFDRMRQEDSSVTRSAGGLGLGLAIAKAIVELHDGTIVAESDGPGMGASFLVRLPLAEPSDFTRFDAIDRPDSAGDLDLGGKRILLVDDEPDAREVAHVALSSLGANVDVAASAAQALRMLQRERFDVLVSDVGMPDMDGLALIRAVRRLPLESGANIAAVALTAFAMESDRRAGIAAGFQSYVAKPISIRRLSEGIMRALELSESPVSRRD
jgi:signal transduction histidine kinase/ActR/RegA family two-component response regulator